MTEGHLYASHLNVGALRAESSQRAADQSCERDSLIVEAAGQEAILDGLEPVTVAIRVCSGCRRYLGTKLWTGKDAWPGVAAIETSGACETCADKAYRDIGLCACGLEPGDCHDCVAGEVRE